MSDQSKLQALRGKIESRDARIGVIGLGMVQPVLVVKLPQVAAQRVPAVLVARLAPVVQQVLVAASVYARMKFHSSAKPWVPVQTCPTAVKQRSKHILQNTRLGFPRYSLLSPTCMATALTLTSR